MKMKTRKGIAMIELIFSIVIMGIALLIAPILMTQTQKGMEAAVKQESISAVASNIEMTMTKEWDEAGTDSSYYPTILETGGFDELNPVINTSRRVGTPLSSKRAFINAGGEKYSASELLSSDGGDSDDVDDHNGKEIFLNVYSTEEASGDYIDKDIKMTTAISYVRATPVEGTFNSNTINFNNPFTHDTTLGAPLNSTNIKAIDILLTTDNTDIAHRKKIRLRAFSSNIGSYQLNERSYK